MITEKDLQEAIAECQGVRSPNANTCIKLAAFLIIQKELYGAEERPVYSYAPAEEYDSGTEFSTAARGLSHMQIMGVIDELMTALQVVNPRLYDSVIRKLKSA